MAGCRQALLAFFLALTPGVALAQSVISSADALYKEGKKLMKEGKTAEACKKFQASYDLEKAGGVLLNLAECHLQEGKTATASGEFQAALEVAQRDKNADRTKHAHKRIRELEGKVPHLTITLEGPRPAGLSLKLDGTELGEGSLGSSLPIDPGKHVLIVAAPKHEPFEEVVEISKPGEARSLSVPALTKQQEPAKIVEVPRKPAPSGGWMWPVGFVGLGLGVVGLAVGGGLGAVALDKGSVVKAECPGDLCSQAGFDAYQSGRGAATAANVGFLAGGVLAAAGIVFLAVAPGDAAPWAKQPKNASSLRFLGVAPSLGGATVGATSLFAW